MNMLSVLGSRLLVYSHTQTNSTFHRPQKNIMKKTVDSRGLMSIYNMFVYANSSYRNTTSRGERREQHVYALGYFLSCVLKVRYEQCPEAKVFYSNFLREFEVESKA